MRTISGVASVVVLLLFAAVRCPAVSIATEVGFAGTVAADTWSPVRVRVAGDTEAFAGTIAIDVPRGVRFARSPAFFAYRKAVSVPIGGNVLVETMVPVGAFPRFVEVRAETATGEVVADERVSLAGKSVGEPLIVAVTDAPDVVVNPATARVVTIIPEHLPSLPEAYAPCPAVVIGSNGASRLSESQVSGLRDYVESGGTILLSLFVDPAALDRLSEIAGIRLSPVRTGALQRDGTTIPVRLPVTDTAASDFSPYLRRIEWGAGAVLIAALPLRVVFADPGIRDAFFAEIAEAPQRPPVPSELTIGPRRDEVLHDAFRALSTPVASPVFLVAVPLLAIVAAAVSPRRHPVAYALCTVLTVLCAVGLVEMVAAPQTPRSVEVTIDVRDSGLDLRTARRYGYYAALTIGRSPLAFPTTAQSLTPAYVGQRLFRMEDIEGSSWIELPGDRWGVRAVRTVSYVDFPTPSPAVAGGPSVRIGDGPAEAHTFETADGVSAHQSSPAALAALLSAALEIVPEGEAGRLELVALRVDSRSVAVRGELTFESRATGVGWGEP